MNYDALVAMFSKQGYFDLPTVAQLSNERRHTLRVQLHRWCNGGKLIPLRRGMYAFPDRYRPGVINPSELANHLYTPSYISRHWALGYFGMIPEAVVTYTSVTSRVPRTFTNAFGTFRYQHVKQSAFFGYNATRIGESRVLLAEPEKALLDFWHLERGTWNEPRMREMRFQNTDTVDVTKLRSYAERFESPRLVACVNLWQEVMRMETEGTVSL
jgi:predicted transcriptional regulator of viral defense system